MSQRLLTLGVVQDVLRRLLVLGGLLLFEIRFDFAFQRFLLLRQRHRLGLLGRIVEDEVVLVVLVLISVPIRYDIVWLAVCKAIVALSLLEPRCAENALNFWKTVVVGLSKFCRVLLF